jgi:excisionase family DNA binding protein
METSPAPELISIGEAARILGVSVQTVRRWEAGGIVSSVRTPTNQRRFDRTQIRDLMVDRSRTA